jgi:magnesium chelatase subunit H
MRERLAKLNPTASAKVANRLIEAHERRYWTADAATLDALRAPARNSKTASKASAKEVAA